MLRSERPWATPHATAWHLPSSPARRLALNSAMALLVIAPVAVVVQNGAELAAAGVEPEYLEARDPDDLSKVAELNGRPVLIAVAARVGIVVFPLAQLVVDGPYRTAATGVLMTFIGLRFLTVRTDRS